MQKNQDKLQTEQSLLNIFNRFRSCCQELFLKKIVAKGHSMHWGTTRPPSKTPPPLFRQVLPPLKSANWPSPTPRFFRRFPPIYCFFVNTPPPKNRVFQWTLIIFKFFILTPSHLLKVTKFLVKISQFKFLLMTEKNIFVGKLFLSLNISDFSLCKNCTSTEKFTPFFPRNPPLKIEMLSSPPPFWKFGRTLNPPAEKEGGCTLWRLREVPGMSLWNTEAVAWRCSVKKMFLEISQNSQENTFVTLFKKRFWHGCFPVNFLKFLRAHFFIEHFQWLLLKMSHC